VTDLPKAEPAELIHFTADIVGSYVSNNAVSIIDLPKLIAEVYGALVILGAAPAEPVEVEALNPAVPIRKSITPDFLICLEDGKKFKSLRRHLTVLGMTADEYRAKWHLPQDYPMVAPNYSATRSQLARANGLGRKPAEPIAAPAPTRRGRKTAAA
jgi:predicted transcriptional regulator